MFPFSLDRSVRAMRVPSTHDKIIPVAMRPRTQKAFASHAAKSFNLLRKEIKDTEGLSSFKKRIFKNIFLIIHRDHDVFLLLLLKCNLFL